MSTEVYCEAERGAPTLDKAWKEAEMRDHVCRREVEGGTCGLGKKNGEKVKSQKSRADI